VVKMDYQKTYEQMKNGAKNIIILYTVLGSLYMFGADTTGHHNADLHEGKAQLSTLEEKMYEPIFTKFNINTDLLRK